MSTRGTILRPAGDGVEGRYHHSDSYPTGLGKALFALRNGHFAGDTNAMLKVLIDDHTGWSTIVGGTAGVDWSLEPGYVEDYAKTIVDARPRCYCHGDRHEEGWLNTGLDESWNYVISGTAMTVFHGSQFVVVVNFDQPEPDWGEIERRGNAL